MVEQCVSAGDEKTIRISAFHRELAWLDTIHAQSPRLDHAFLAQPGKRFGRALHGGIEDGRPVVAVKVLRRIVDPHIVQAIGFQTTQTVVDRTQRAVLAVVVDDLVRQAVLEQTAFLPEVALVRCFDFIEDQTADLRSKHVFTARMRLQRFTQTNLGQTCAIERRAIEITNARLPCSLDRVQCFLFRNLAEHVAKRRSAEADTIWNGDAHDATPYRPMNGNIDSKVTSVRALLFFGNPAKGRRLLSMSQESPFAVELLTCY